MPWYDWFPYEAVPNSPQYGPYIVECERLKNYYWCKCGLSKTQPWCDGSHKGTAFKPTLYIPRYTGYKALCGCKMSEHSPKCNLTHLNVFANNKTPKACGYWFVVSFGVGGLASYLMHP